MNSQRAAQTQSTNGGATQVWLSDGGWNRGGSLPVVSSSLFAGTGGHSNTASPTTTTAGGDVSGIAASGRAGALPATSPPKNATNVSAGATSAAASSGGNAGRSAAGTSTSAGRVTATRAGSGNLGGGGISALGLGGLPGTAGSRSRLDLDSPATILEAMQRANAWFAARWPDPTKDIVTDKTRPSNLWTRAVYYEGLLGLYSVETDPAKKSSYYDYAVTWASAPSHRYTLTYTDASTMTANADNQACGQTYLDLYRIDPQQERLSVIKANIDAMLNNKTTNAWTWIDALQMAMPVLAKLGSIVGENKYFDAMWSLYEFARNQAGGGLYNPDDGLWWRDQHFTPGGGTKQIMTSKLNASMPSSSSDAYIVAPNGKNLYWSRGNGWVMAALVRVLDEIPANDPHRADYLSDLSAMAQALLPLQRSDGFWSESLADPTHCESIGLSDQDGPETSGTSLFVVGLAWGIRNGYLDADRYGPALIKAWNGLVSVALGTDGLLGYVQSTGDRPCTGPAPLSAKSIANFDDYGVGCFLLAGTEVYRLASN